MKYRMYGLVVRSLSEIQKGIQFGHAVVEYELMSRKDEDIRNMYDQFAHYDKTFIILNGGSTNCSTDELQMGTLQKYNAELITNGVKTAIFYEPDLNDASTAIVFLVDERVWDRETYLDYIKLDDYADFGQQANHYLKWVEQVGGPTNAFLRSFLSQFKLA